MGVYFQSKRAGGGPQSEAVEGRMDEKVCELVLLAVVSAGLCGVALMYEQRLATAIFAALTCGTVVIAAGLHRRR